MSNQVAVAPDSIFTPTEICALVGCSQRHLLWWLQKGLLRASIRESEGRGSRRLFSERDAFEAKVAAVTTAVANAEATEAAMSLVRGIADVEALDDADVLVISPKRGPRLDRFVTAEDERAARAQDGAQAVVGIGLIKRFLPEDIRTMREQRARKLIQS